MGMPKDFLRGLAPRRKALVLPFVMDRFSPGSSSYEDLVGTHRGVVDVFALVNPFGIMSEKEIIAHPEILRVSAQTPDRKGRKESAVRLRAWLNTHGERYGTIGLIATGPHMPVWSRAVQGSSAASRVRLIPVHKGTGLRGSVLKRNISRVLQ